MLFFPFVAILQVLQNIQMDKAQGSTHMAHTALVCTVYVLSLIET